METTSPPKRNPMRPRRMAVGRARGAAFAEAVILLLFMIIVFAGVQYLARYFDAKQQALLTARRCAWIFSKNACVEDDANPLPAECRDVVGGRVREEPNTELRDAVDTHAGNTGPGTAGNPETDAPASSGTESHLRGGVNNSLHKMVELVVGQSLTAIASEEIQRTPVTALARGRIGASYYLPCNLAKRDPFDVVSELWNGLVSIP